MVLVETAELSEFPFVLMASTGKAGSIISDDIASQNVSRLLMALLEADAHLSGILAIDEKGD